MFKKLFTPITIGNQKLTLRNRLVVGPMEVGYCNPDGTVTERYLKYVETKAKGGWGLIITESHAVTYGARAFNNCSGMWDDSQIEGEKMIADAVHKHGAKSAVQLIHGGRQSIASNVEVVAPSAIKDPTLEITPRELTIPEIEEIIEAFGDAALRVKKAGHDAVEIHGAHGYLIQEFTSPFSNKRTDKYGGTLENRARFSLEIIKNIREKVGEDFTVMYRMSTTEMLPNGEGITIADSRALARMYENAGVDVLHCSVGNYTSGRYVLPPAAVAHGFSADYAEEIRKVVDIPVINVGRYNDPLLADAALINGKADMICMSRASLADPDLPNKAKEGKGNDIIRCIGCNIGCVGQLYKHKPIKCALNPLTGRETEYLDEPADIKKNVLVIGGGMAGMEAAIAASKRGHAVTLIEKGEKLGGQWLLAAIPPYKQELSNFTVWQTNQIDKLGVDVKLNTSFDDSMLDELKPDAIILATGATPITPRINGVDHDNVCQANDILASKKIAGETVAVIGGGEVGAETAAHLASLNKKVAVFEMADGIAMGSEGSSHFFLMEYLNTHNVDIFTSAKVLEIKDNAIVFEKDGQTQSYSNLDTVVLALGSRPENTLYDQLKGKVDKLVMIGDAEKVQQGIHAVEAGYKAGYYI